LLRGKQNIIIRGTNFDLNRSASFSSRGHDSFKGRVSARTRRGASAASGIAPEGSLRESASWKYRARRRIAN